MVNRDFWLGRRVFLTGHTGFKGSWLALWLSELGAEVSGFALPAPTTPALFHVAGVETTLHSTLGDIRDKCALNNAMQAARPEIVLHLAAQPLVSEGYEDPVGTYATNVMGTVNLLDCTRALPDIRAIVVVTTDKCYANDETGRPYRENDRLGGRDPYSNSKACAELVCDAYRQSFLSDQGIYLATARAGNVIGGGDWAKHRLVPDLLAAFSAGEVARLRNPHAVRPWQHVLEPLSGYLQLAEALTDDPGTARAWNFGPEATDCVSTGELADQLSVAWAGDARWIPQPITFPHEAGLLSLDASEAKARLKWRPKWSLIEAIRQTTDWHRAWLAGKDMQAVCRHQIKYYTTTEDDTRRRTPAHS